MIYKEKGVGSKANISIGFIPNLYVDFKGEKSVIPFFDGFSFIKENWTGEKCLNDLKKFIKEEMRYIPRGVFLLYKIPETIKLKHYWEFCNKLENVVRAIRIMTNQSCKLLFDMDCCNDIPYIPNSNIVPLDFPEEMEIIKIKKEDFKELKTIFGRLEGLNLSNFTKYSRLKNSINFYDNACYEKGHLLKLVNFFISLESLFSDDKKSEISYKIRLRTACINYPERNRRKERKEVFNLIKEGYNIRSLFLHGSDVDNSIKKRNTSGYSYFEDYLPKIRFIVEKTIKHILLNKKEYELFSDERKSKKPKEITEYLDSMVLGL